MANPTKPTIETDYSAWQAEQQTTPFPGTQLDTDLIEMKRGVDDTIDALASVRREDGKIQNGAVDNDSLDASVVLDKLGWSGAWATATDYVANQIVSNGGSSYICILSHTAAAANEPGVGASQATYWALVAQKGDLPSGAAIKAAYEAEADTNAFDDAAVAKLAGIEAGADVTDHTNVEAAGALMADENLNDLSNKDTALLVLGGGTVGINVFKDGTPEGIRSTIGAIIGTNVQAWDPKLDVLSSTGASPHCTALAAFKALDTTQITAAIYDGRSWEWKLGDYSAEVTADSLGAYFVKANAVATTVGAWLARDRDYLDIQAFGGVDDGVDTCADITEYKGDWATTTSYAVGDHVMNSGLGYKCLEAHTSGTFSTDLAAAKWVLGEFTGTDNYAAMEAMRVLHKATGIRQRMDGKLFRVVNPTTGTNDPYLSLTGNYEIEGTGTILVDHDGTASKSYNFFQISGHPLTNRNVYDVFSVEGLTFRGRWHHVGGATDMTHIFRVSGFRRVIIKNCKFYDIPGNVSRNSAVNYVYCEGNIAERISGDVFRFQDSNNAFILNNRIRHTSDDAINVHSSDSTDLCTSTLIEDNILSQCEGIVCLGAHLHNVQGNILELCNGTGIQIGGRVSDEGDNAAIANSIANNSVIDLISSSTDGSTLPASASTKVALSIASVAAAKIAGDYDTSAVVDAIKDELYYLIDSDTTDVPQGTGAVIVGNKVKRTRNSATNYSDFGKGLMFYKSGFINPAVDDDDFATNGVGLLSDINGAVVKANDISGFRAGSGIYFRYLGSGATLDWAFKNVVVVGNVVYDCLNGVNHSQSSGAVDIAAGISIIANRFNLDPAHVSAARLSATGGTWDSAASDGDKNYGIRIRRWYGLVIHSNTFENLYEAMYADSAFSHADYANNVVICQPTSHAYSASNTGVGVPYHAFPGFRHIIMDCTPTSSTFGEILNHCVTTKSSIPTSGIYLKGHIVWNSNPTISGGKTLEKWIKLATGSGHVSSTDWAPSYSTTS